MHLSNCNTLCETRENGPTDLLRSSVKLLDAKLNKTIHFLPYDMKELDKPNTILPALDLKISF